MQRGYIKLWRCAQDNEMYFCEPFTKWQAWIDLVLLANHKPNTVTIRGIDVRLEPGQVLAGEEFLATRWKWSRGKVRRFTSKLSQKTVQQIVQQKNNVCTVLSIVNWSHYQADGTENGTANSTTDGQQTDIPKNYKNYKNTTYCAEPETDSTPPNEIFLTFPTTGKPKQWHLSKSKLNEYKATFDTLDVGRECRKALQWILDNSSKRKTARGMSRYLGNWLSRAADDPRTPKQGSQTDENPLKGYASHE